MGRDAVANLVAEDQTFTEETWAAITESEFSECRFEGCDISEAVFRAARFIDCTFVRCDMSLMKVTDCTFGGSRFEDCRMLGIDWTRGTWPRIPLHEPNTFVRCDLSMNTFTDLVLGAVRFEECRLREAGFRHAFLADSVFDGSDCAGADFLEADLSGASLQRTVSLIVDPRTTRLEGATVDAATGAAILESRGINLAMEDRPGPR